MGKIIFVTGGARSGKSSFAENYCLEKGRNLGYIATAEILDEEIKDRVRKHRSQRGDRWETYEHHLNIEDIVEDLLNKHDYVLLDCITIYMSNMMFSKCMNFENISIEETNNIELYIIESISGIIEKAKIANGNLVIVSNEIGLGIVPENKIARIYRDYAGRANQICASQADEVYMVISSIPVKIK
ncbi:MAG: bifunctional adenosylcobinamide kinase/adenosylcobinamide-phosphate guanylyltransferase [Proteocatella sp.]